MTRHRKRRRKKKKPASSKVHDAIIRSLEDRLRSPKHTMLREYKYKHHGDHEADLLVMNYNRRYAYAIEVKTTNHRKARKHARWQLLADEAYIKSRFKIDRVFKFYAYKAKRRSERFYDIRLIHNN